MYATHHSPSYRHCSYPLKEGVTYLAVAFPEAPPAECPPGAGLGAEEPGVARLALALPRQEVAGAVAGGAGRAGLLAAHAVEALRAGPVAAGAGVAATADAPA